MQPVLMLDQADVAADLNRLQELEHAGVDTDGLLLDLGKIVELRHAIAAAKYGSSVPVRSFGAADMADMARLARRLLRLAIDTVGRIPPLDLSPLSSALSKQVRSTRHLRCLHSYLCVACLDIAEAWLDLGIIRQSHPRFLGIAGMMHLDTTQVSSLQRRKDVWSIAV